MHSGCNPNAPNSSNGWFHFQVVISSKTLKDMSNYHVQNGTKNDTVSSDLYFLKKEDNKRDI